VVVSAAILAIGIVGIFLVITSAYRVIKSADKEMAEPIGNLITFNGTDTGAGLLPSQTRERNLCLGWKNKIEEMLGTGSSGTISIEQNAPEPGVIRITVSITYIAMGVRRTQRVVFLRAPVH
jgi:hypothetical protein